MTTVLNDDEQEGLLRTILGLEIKLIERNDPSLAELLDPAFREIGRSGRLWRRDDVVADLAKPPTERIEVTEAEISQPAPGLALITYLSLAGSRRTRRTSLWQGGDGGWRLLFHQGTDLA